MRFVSVCVQYFEVIQFQIFSGFYVKKKEEERFKRNEFELLKKIKFTISQSINISELVHIFIYCKLCQRFEYKSRSSEYKTQKLMDY